MTTANHKDGGAAPPTCHSERSEAKSRNLSSPAPGQERCLDKLGMTCSSRARIGFLAWSALVLTASSVGAAERAGRIVFSSNRSEQWRIWTIVADGSGIKQLTQGTPDDNDIDPVFSPDAKSILFTSTRGGKPGVWRMGADGSKPERLCDGDQAEWSPDASKLALRRGEKILTRDLATGAEKTLTPDGFPHCSGPAWSPNAKTIAFACRWDAGNGIFLVPSDGSGKPTKLYDQQGACEPHWSPDGETIIYETETHIATIAPDGSKNRLVTHFGGVQRYGRFSPDAKWIVFCQGVSERGPWELYLIPAAGGTPVKLTEDGSDMYPDWK